MFEEETIQWFDAKTETPPSIEILVIHSGGVDRALFYGSIFRLAHFSEDQLYGVTFWAHLPSGPLKTKS